MSKPTARQRVLAHASRNPMIDRSSLLPWALLASIVLHALLLLSPALRLRDAASMNKPVVLTARIVEREPPAPTVEPPPDLLKNTLEQQAKPPAPPPATPRRESDAKRAARRPAEQAEQLPPEQLEATLARLSETLFYPPEALRRNLEGEVVLMLELGDGGRILQASVASGSGHAVLDDAALRAARKLGSLGPAAAGRTILLPVRFRLQ